MALEDIRENRLKKLKAILNAGLLAFPQRTQRTHLISEAISNFRELSHQKREIIIVGRIMAKREHGGSTFCHIQDASGKIQVYFKLDALGKKGYEFFLKNFDIGDFIETRGILFKTQQGERTLEVKDFKMLAKALLPLPEKWHGLQDIEERFRKRYLDLIFNSEVKEKFIVRAKILKALREFLDQEGFIEVETPILQTIYGGAEANPFLTHINAFNLDVYLRIAPELYLKRLLVGGFEKVYEIGRCFRNEGVDRSHNPDFTMLEFYWAFADYKDMMRLTERLFEYLLEKVFGTSKIKYEGKILNFKAPYPRIEYGELLQKYAKFDVFSINKAGAEKIAKKLEVKVEKAYTKEKIVDAIYKKYCLPKLWQPTFVLHHPASMKPLAKTLEKNPVKAANFQLVVAGWELVNAFSELNDPLMQLENFKKQEELRKKGDLEAHPLDKEFIEALEYGMPPAAGFGMGIDRLTALLTNSHSLREVILFPLMRPRLET